MYIHIHSQIICVHRYTGECTDTGCICVEICMRVYIDIHTHKDIVNYPCTCTNTGWRSRPAWSNISKPRMHQSAVWAALLPKIDLRAPLPRIDLNAAPASLLLQRRIFRLQVIYFAHTYMCMHAAVHACTWMQTHKFKWIFT